MRITYEPEWLLKVALSISLSLSRTYPDSPIKAEENLRYQNLAPLRAPYRWMLQFLSVFLPYPLTSPSRRRGARPGRSYNSVISNCRKSKLTLSRVYQASVGNLWIRDITAGNTHTLQHSAHYHGPLRSVLIQLTLLFIY